MSPFPGRDVMSEHLSCTLLWLRCTNPAPGLIPRSAGAMLDTRSGLLFLLHDPERRRADNRPGRP